MLKIIYRTSRNLSGFSMCESALMLNDNLFLSIMDVLNVG